jgi:hypothetical protein
MCNTSVILTTHNLHGILVPTYSEVKAWSPATFN